jgi:1,4-dihydroxy-2-naphthoate octaprenyltransferase
LKTKAWINAFRLRTLPLALAVILAGTAVSFLQVQNFTCDDCSDAIYNDASISKPSILIFALILLTTILLQILSNLANDYGDFVKGTDNADRIGPERTMQGGLITKKQMFNAIILFSCLSFISGLSLLYFSFTKNELPYALSFVGIGLLCIAAAIKYTIGKKAYGYNALGDVAVIVFFGGVGILGTQYLQTKTLNLQGIYMAIAFGFWSAGVLNLNNMRDVDNDVLYKKFTLAYYFGFNKSKIYQAILVALPYAFTYLTLTYYMKPNKALLALIALPLSLMMLSAIIKVKNRKEFDKFLKIQALLTLINSIVLLSCIYLLHEQTN